MEKKNDMFKNIISWILPIILLVLIGVLGLKVVEIKKDNDRYKALIEEYKKEIDTLKNNFKEDSNIDDNQSNNQNDDSKNNNVSDDKNTVSKKNVYEEYKASFSPLYQAEDPYSSLTLYDDNTFKYDVNLCEGVSSIDGKYEKDNDKLVLSSLENMFHGFSGDDLETITFEIQSDGTLKSMEDVGCVFKDTEFSLK